MSDFDNVTPPSCFSLYSTYTIFYSSPDIFLLESIYSVYPDQLLRIGIKIVTPVFNVFNQFYLQAAAREQNQHFQSSADRTNPLHYMAS